MCGFRLAVPFQNVYLIQGRINQVASVAYAMHRPRAYVAPRYGKENIKHF